MPLKITCRGTGSLQGARLTEELIKTGERHIGNVDVGDVGRLVAPVEKLPKRLSVDDRAFARLRLQKQPQRIFDASFAFLAASSRISRYRRSQRRGARSFKRS